LGHETLKSYDADGHVNGVQYPAGNLFSMEYDLAGRQIAATDGKSNMVTYGYDPDGRMTSLVNRRGFQYQWAYNDSARTDSSTTPTGSSTTTEFAGTGLPTQVAQPSGQVGSFTGYDAEGRLTDYSDSVGTKHMTYWENGLLHQVTMSPAGGGSYTSNRNYDEQNRLSEYDDGFGNTFLYTYYPDNRLDTVTYPGGNVVTYTYDDFGRMSTVTDWAGRVTTYGYDAASRLISIARPNQTRRALAYYGDSRLMQIQDYKSNGTILFFERLSYDANGRVASTFLNPANPAYTLPGDGLTFDGDNALLTWSGSGGSVSVVRDADGNMTQGPLPDGAAGSYVFDSRDRLVSAGTVSGYSYNPDELRVGLSGPSGTVSYAIDPNRSLSSVMVRNQGGSTTYYVYGLGLLYEDTDGSTETYHFDHAGNTVALTAQDGQTVTDRVSYSTYGNVTSRTGTTGTPFLFGGEVGVMTDPNGLYYMRARYYNPRIMRFVNADPIRFGGGTNWYAYCGNDPVANIDPTGLGAQGAMQAINDSVVNGGRLPAFVTHATAVAEDIITWAEGTGDAAELTALWATGLGKPTYHFDSTYALTRLMENAPGVRQSIAKYTALNQGNGNPASYEPLTNNAVGFGLNGYLESGLNPAEQFIGGYNVTITPNGASNINITITNVTSLGSLLADNWQYSYPQSPKHITPGGNQTQTYTWTQPYP
jgi:RHS repeat-associated protein